MSQKPFLPENGNRVLCYVYHEVQLMKSFALFILVGWKLFDVGLFWKKDNNFFCVLVSKANMLRKPGKKFPLSNSYIFRWDPSFSIQLTEVWKYTVFQKYKIKSKSEEWKST